METNCPGSAFFKSLSRIWLALLVAIISFNLSARDMVAVVASEHVITLNIASNDTVTIKQYCVLGVICSLHVLIYQLPLG